MTDTIVSLSDLNTADEEALHPLYYAVSSDQPPLFTQILALVLRLAGFEVNYARVLVILFSTLLVWSGAHFLQLTSGKLAAILFLPLAIMAPRYLELSVSVMIGVPAIALATVSLLFVSLWHLKRTDLWLVLSGFALALSVLFKLFTGFLVPNLPGRYHHFDVSRWKEKRIFMENISTCIN